jgi:epoxide hydrolase
MLYWLTATSGFSARIHKESTMQEWSLTGRSSVPTAVAVFPGAGASRSIAERQHNLVRRTGFDRGGHFAAMQARTCWSTTSARSSATSADPCA